MLKRRVERALASDLVTRFTRRRVHGKSLILAYHAIVPDGITGPAPGERALYVAQSKFAEQLDVLKAIADVVPLDQIDNGRPDRATVAITFDDAYQGAVTVAVRELAARHLPATIFVAPGRLDRHVFWWDALAHGRGEMDPRVRTHALESLNGDDGRVRAWAKQNGSPGSNDLPDFARSATLEELIVAASTPGITFGSHSWSHPNLATLPLDELLREMTRPYDWLRTHLASRTLPWLAYPYGRESSMVRQAARAAGYTAALRISGGWHRGANVDPFARPRLNVGGGMTIHGFRARLLGAIPA